VDLRPLSPKQARSIREADARMNLWHGSVSSGKTIASLIRWADAIDQHDGNGSLVMAGKTERTLKRNNIEPLTEILGTEAVQLRQGSGEVTVLGETVYLVGANDERAEQKIRGMTIAKFYGDEVTLWPESFHKMAMTRLRVPRARLKRDWIDRADEHGPAGFRHWHFTLRDNMTLNEEYIAALARENTGLWRKRFVDGLWVLAEGAIWEVDDDVHYVAVVPDGLEFRNYIVGVDYGTANPFVALLIAEDQHGRFWVLSEWRWDSRVEHAQRTDAQYSAAVGAWLDEWGVTPSAVYVDPSATSFILQLRQDHPWTIIEADNTVDDGLRMVNVLFGAGSLFILDRCEGLIGEIGGYVWDPVAQEKGEDRPIKRADHGPDALRYALQTYVAHSVGSPQLYGWVA